MCVSQALAQARVPYVASVPTRLVVLAVYTHYEQQSVAYVGSAVYMGGVTVRVYGCGRTAMVDCKVRTVLHCTVLYCTVLYCKVRTVLPTHTAFLACEFGPGYVHRR